MHISCLFSLDTERDAFIQHLVDFSALKSALTTTFNTKNLEAIKVLLNAAHADVRLRMCFIYCILLEQGNRLGVSWKAVLTIVSNFELAQETNKTSTLPEGVQNSIGVAVDKIFTLVC